MEDGQWPLETGITYQPPCNFLASHWSMTNNKVTWLAEYEAAWPRNMRQIESIYFSCFISLVSKHSECYFRVWGASHNSFCPCSRVQTNSICTLKVKVWCLLEKVLTSSCSMCRNYFQALFKIISQYKNNEWKGNEYISLGECIQNEKLKKFQGIKNHFYEFQGPNRLRLPRPDRDRWQGRRGDSGRPRRGLGLQPRLLDWHGWETLPFQGLGLELDIFIRV